MKNRNVQIVSCHTRQLLKRSNDKKSSVGGNDNVLILCFRTLQGGLYFIMLKVYRSESH